MKALLISLGILIILGVGAGGYYYFISRTPDSSVKIELTKPEEIYAGTPFEVGLNYTNLSQEQGLENAKISFVLPENVFAIGKPKDLRVIEETVGNVGPGEVGKKNVTFIVTDEVNVVKRLEVHFKYNLPGNQAQIDHESLFDIPIGDPAISMDFKLPEKVFSGENFDLEIHYRNNSKFDFRNLKLKVKFPNSFHFVSSEPISTGVGEWLLENLPRNSEGTIKLKGNLVGQEESRSGFPVSLSADFLGQSYDIQKQDASVLISTPPLSIRFEVNNTENYVAKIGDKMFYKLKYKNNSATPLRNVIIQAALLGELFDFSSLRAGASLNSITNTLEWSVANTPSLAVVSPGEEGSLSFDIALKDKFPIDRLSDKNFTLKVNGKIESETVPQGVAAAKTVSANSLETKVRGLVELDAVALYSDSASGITNSGPYPPKINQKTQYTIHWKIKNYSTDISGVKISAFLQSGTQFTGKVKSNIDATPSYNSATGEVTLEIPSIPATKGIISEPIDVVFQVENTPAINQLNQYITIMGESKLTAKDEFIGDTIQAKDRELTTALPDETKVVTQDRRVRQ